MADESKQSLEEMQRMLEAYREEFELNADADIATKVEQVFDNSLEEVAQRMLHLAMHSEDERVQFQASKYCLDNRVFFKQGHQSGRGEFAQLLDRLKANDEPVGNKDSS